VLSINYILEQFSCAIEYVQASLLLLLSTIENVFFVTISVVNVGSGGVSGGATACCCYSVEN